MNNGRKIYTTARLKRFEKELEGIVYVSDIVCMTRYAPTGEVFLTIGGGGIKPEGKEDVFFSSERDCVESYIKNVKKYIKDNGTTLYWRKRPEVQKFSDKSGDRYRIYSRMLATNLDIDEDYFEEHNYLYWMTKS